MIRIILPALLFLFCGLAHQAWARPEFVRHGYFTCTSCHVSPAGGGLLKAYGRMIAAEKLVTWRRENEESPLYGLDTPSETWAVGGGIRWLQISQESKRASHGQFFKMNSDLEIGAKVARTWFSVRLGIAGSERVSSSHWIQHEPAEGVYLRAGRFQTRFGIMTPDHSASVRRGTKLAAGSEARQVELTWSREWFDSTLSVFKKGRDQKILGLTVDSAISREEDGAAIHTSFFVMERMRIGFQALGARDESRTRRVAGVHAGVPVGSDWTLLHETDRIWTHDAPTNESSRSRSSRSEFSWSKLVYEAAKGVSPWGWHDLSRPDVSSSRGHVEGVGLGLTLRPRPHFNIDLASGIWLERQTWNARTGARAVLHWWF